MSRSHPRHARSPPPLPAPGGFRRGTDRALRHRVDPARHRVLLRAQSEYTILHTILEFTSMAISLMVVALAWNLRDLERNSQVMLIGWFSLGVLLVDLAHTLSFPGMPPLVSDSTAQKAITFWLAGRIAAAVGFLLLALVPTRHWNPRLWLPGVVRGHGGSRHWPCWVGLYHTQWVPTFFVPGDRAHHDEGGDRVRAVRRVRGRGSPPAAPRPSRAERRARLACHGRLDTGAGRALLHPLRERRRRLQPAGPCAQGRRLHHGVPGDLRRRRPGSLPAARPRDVAAAIADRLRSRPHLLHRPGGPPPRGQPGVQLAVPRRHPTMPSDAAPSTWPGRTAGPGPGCPACRTRASASRRRCRTARASCSTSTPSRRRTSRPRANGSASSRSAATSRRSGAAEERIHQLALYDQLTGLPNRVLLGDEADASFADPALAGQAQALVFLDLDDFKTINDTVGHRIGDLLIQEAAQRLVAAAGPEAQVARLGGDEFAVLAAPSSLAGDHGARWPACSPRSTSPSASSATTWPSPRRPASRCTRPTARPSTSWSCAPTPPCTAPSRTGATPTASSAATCWPMPPSAWSC